MLFRDWYQPADVNLKFLPKEKIFFPVCIIFNLFVALISRIPTHEKNYTH